MSGTGDREGKGPEVGVSWRAGGKRPGRKMLGVSKRRVTWNRRGNSKLFIRLSSQPKSRR